MLNEGETEERNLEALAVQIVQESVSLVKHRGAAQQWDNEAERRWKCASDDLRRWQRQQRLMDQILHEQSQEEVSETTQDKTVSSGESSLCFSPPSNITEAPDQATQEPSSAPSPGPNLDETVGSGERSIEEPTDVTSQSKTTTK